MTHSQEYYNGWNDWVKRWRELMIIEMKKTGWVVVDIPDTDNKLKEKLIEYLQYRIEIKKPVRQASAKAFQKRLEKMSWWNIDIACDILEQSIANGWQWIFPVKNTTSSQSKVWIAQA